MMTHSVVMSSMSQQCHTELARFLMKCNDCIRSSLLAQPRHHAASLPMERFPPRK
jgi:hypothetical protein